LSSFEKEHKKYAAVFADIRGFTELCKLHDVEQIEMIVGDWFVTAYRDKIAKFGGLVDKFLGDGMLLFFERTESAFYASCALRGLAKEIDQHLNGGQAKGWLGGEFAIGIGLEYGEVVEGRIPIGNQEHVLRIGECVNMASRLGEIAEPWEILVGNDAHAQLRGKVDDEIFGKITRGRRRGGEYDCWQVAAEAVL